MRTRRHIDVLYAQFAAIAVCAFLLGFVIGKVI